MQTKSKILMLSGVALLVPALLLAQAAEKHLRGGGAFARHMIRELDLTPDQVQQVKTIFANNKADLTTELTALKTARGQLFDAIHADTPDDTAIQTAAPAVGQAEGNLGVTRAKVLGEVRQAMLLQRVGFGPGAMTAREALEIATLGGARVLGRDDIGAPADLRETVALDNEARILDDAAQRSVGRIQRRRSFCHRNRLARIADGERHAAARLGGWRQDRLRLRRSAG